MLDRLFAPPFIAAVNEHDRAFSFMLGAEKTIDHERCHHCFTSAGQTRTEESRLLRLRPFLVPWVLQKPLSSIGLSSINIVAMLHGVICRTDPFQQFSLALYRGVVLEGCRMVLDNGSGINDRAVGYLQVGEAIVNLVYVRKNRTS